MTAATAAISFGLILVLVTLQDVFEVLLLPRRQQRRWRLASGVVGFTWNGWSGLARLLRPGNGRAVFLSIYGPFSVVLLYMTWAISLIVGFGLCQWGSNAGIDAPPSLLSDLYFSGSTFFTLGFGDVVPQTRPGKVFAVLEAGSGFGLIAAVIGYLPVLYQLFSRREAHVIQLDARAGSPPSAVTLLASHADGGAMAELDAFLRAWEVWGAELLESHLSYPMLVFYRSHHDNQSWLAALTTIMDSCALVLCGFEGMKTFQARMTFAMGRMVIIEMTRALGLSPATVSGDRLPTSAYDEMARRLQEAGLAPSDPQREARLAAFRTTYEPFLIALSDFLMLGLPEWRPTTEPDNWQASVHGGLARKLVEAVPARPPH